MSSRAPQQSDIGRLLEMVNGFRATSIIATAVRLGVFESLAKGPAEELAVARELHLHERSFTRLVRALRVLGLVSRVDGGLALTPAGRLLVKGRFGVRDWAFLVGTEYLPAWAELAHSIKTGQTAFEHRFGATPWEHRKAHPDDDEAFNRVMTGNQARAAAALLDAWDFGERRRIVDVGGGRGSLLAAILKRYPAATGVLHDQPHVVAGAHDAFAASGIAERVSVVGGSFFESVPEGDVLLLKHCLHNWDDEDCVTILKNCRNALDHSGILLVLEDVMPDEEPVEAAADAIVMLDMHMLAVVGGRERTLQEHKALLAAAGLDLVRRIATKEGAPDVLEARAI